MGPAVRRNELTEAIMPRIPAIATKDQMQPEHQYVFDQVMDVFGRVRGPFSMLLHSPKLAERLLPMVPYAREGTIIDPKLRQVAVLAAVRERDIEVCHRRQLDQPLGVVSFEQCIEDRLLDTIGAHELPRVDDDVAFFLGQR